MKMKKMTMILTGTMLLAMPAFAASTDAADSTASGTTSTRATILLERLKEIHSMDKTAWSHAEKKVLRKEVRSIKRELKTMDKGRGVYLSVGAIIIITLLLILLL